MIEIERTKRCKTESSLLIKKASLKDFTQGSKGGECLGKEKKECTRQRE